MRSSVPAMAALCARDRRHGRHAQERDDGLQLPHDARRTCVSERESLGVFADNVRDLVSENARHRRGIAFPRHLRIPPSLLQFVRISIAGTNPFLARWKS